LLVVAADAPSAGTVCAGTLAAGAVRADGSPVDRERGSSPAGVPGGALAGADVFTPGSSSSRPAGGVCATAAAAATNNTVQAALESSLIT
jgi:hypothetical protein